MSSESEQLYEEYRQHNLEAIQVVKADLAEGKSPADVFINFATHGLAIKDDLTQQNLICGITAALVMMAQRDIMSEIRDEIEGGAGHA